MILYPAALLNCSLDLGVLWTFLESSFLKKQNKFLRQNLKYTLKKGKQAFQKELHHDQELEMFVCFEAWKSAVCDSV